MEFYSRVVFPRIYDKLVDHPYWHKHRSEQLARVKGEILEIGVGTGLNLLHYPSHVHRITTVDPNPGMNQRLQKRIAQSGIEVDSRIIGSESLPFDAGRFDSVVSTLTLCSIKDLDRALGELFRVLKPGGKLLFLEHGLSPDRNIAKWQRRLNGLCGLVGDGCRIDVDYRDVFSRQPFSDVRIENFLMEQTPKTHAYMYRGEAVK